MIRPRRSERWVVPVELVILLPLFGLIVVWLIAASAAGGGRNGSEAFAREVAREVAAASDPVVAAAAVASPQRTDDCRELTLVVSIVADSAEVKATCRTDLRLVGLIPLPGTWLSTITVVEAIERSTE